MATLTKAELIKRINQQLSLPHQQAQDLVESVLEEICLCLEENEEVKISGFGNFDLRDKRARPGRNPRTGEVVSVSARRVVTFHPGQKLKHRIDQNVESIKGQLGIAPNT